MKICNHWTTNEHLVAMSDDAKLHFIELQKMNDFLERNNFLDWHFNSHDDLETAIHRGKLTFDEWLQETERCRMDIVCYLESRQMIDNFLNPINNILKHFKR